MRALLWDMNGVLVADEPIQEAAWTAALSAAGAQLEDGWWREHFLGRKVSGTLERLFPDSSPSSRDELLADKRRRYREASEAGLPVVPGATDLLVSARRRGIAQALVTSASEAEMSLVLEQLDVRHIFETLVCGSDVGRGKPDPEGFLLGAQRLDVAPQDCWVIEDTIAGIQAAHAAEMRCVAITTSFTAEELREAEIVVNEFGPELLGQL